VITNYELRAKKAGWKNKKTNWGGLQTSQAGVLNERLFD